MFATLIGLRYLHARGHYYLATDRVLAAISDFQTCGRLMQEWELDRPMLVPWRSNLAEANLRLSRWGVARDLVTEQMDRLKPIDLRTRGVSLLILAAASGLAPGVPSCCARRWSACGRWATGCCCPGRWPIWPRPCSSSGRPTRPGR